MKFLTGSIGIAILAVVLGLGTTAGLLYTQRSIFQVVHQESLPPRLWSFKTDQIESLVDELKLERVKLDKRDADMEQTAAHIEAERQELEKVKASIQSMRDEIAKEIPEIQEGEIKNLKGLAMTYSEVTPAAAVTIFHELDDVTVVKILSLMKPDKVAGILQAMAQAQNQDDTIVKRAARISDKLRLIKPLKPQQPPQ